MEHNRLATLRDGDALPERIHVCDSVQLFLYNAALWNAHRVHEIDRQARRVRLELFVRNAAGEVVAPGAAVVELAAG